MNTTDNPPAMLEVLTTTPSGKTVPLITYVGGEYVRMILMNEGTFAFKLTFKDWAVLRDHIDKSLEDGKTHSGS